MTAKQEKHTEPEGPFTASNTPYYGDAIFDKSGKVVSLETVCAMLNSQHRSGIGEEEMTPKCPTCGSEYIGVQFCDGYALHGWCESCEKEFQINNPSLSLRSHPPTPNAPSAGVIGHQALQQCEECNGYLLDNNGTIDNCPAGKPNAECCGPFNIISLSVAPSPEIIEKLVEALCEIRNKTMVYTKGYVRVMISDLNRIAFNALALIDGEKK